MSSLAVNILFLALQVLCLQANAQNVHDRIFHAKDEECQKDYRMYAGTHGAVECNRASSATCSSVWHQAS